MQREYGIEPGSVFFLKHPFCESLQCRRRRDHRIFQIAHRRPEAFPGSWRRRQPCEGFKSWKLALNHLPHQLLAEEIVDQLQWRFQTGPSDRREIIPQTEGQLVKR